MSIPTRFLLIDDDPDFLAYFLLSAEPFAIICDTAASMQEARQKINTSSYAAYIIDLKLPDGLGQDLIKEIYEKLGNKYPIVAVAGINRDPMVIQSLREKYKIEFVLDKPIYPQQINKLFATLANKCDIKQLRINSVLQKLRETYQKTIPEKLENLTSLITSLHQNPDKATLTELRGVVHKIAGSAGTYGFLGVSEICRDMEKSIVDELELSKVIEKDWILSLDDFLEKVKHYFQINEEQTFPPKETSRPQKLTRPLIFVADSDIKFLELLEKEKGKYSIELTYTADPQMALDRLNSPEFMPKAVLVSQRFSGSTITGLDIIYRLQEKPHLKSAAYGVMLMDDDLESKILLMENGVEYNFQKPIDPDLFFDAVDKMIQVRQLQELRK